MSNEENTLNAGSSPAKRTNFPSESENSGACDTETTQNNARIRRREHALPKTHPASGQVLATIYGKSKAYPAYRLAWRVTGKRRMERFHTYSEAKSRADALVKELAQGSHVTALTASAGNRCAGRS